LLGRLTTTALQLVATAGTAGAVGPSSLLTGATSDSKRWIGHRAHAGKDEMTREQFRAKVMEQMHDRAAAREAGGQ
jgi:hypothetical protein